MRARSIGAAATMLLLVAAGSARAQALKVGSPAPPLAVKEFVKGKPVSGFDKGKLYVVEFWATWCGPCKMSAPHLTQLQKKYAAVTVIGVSVWENNQADVKPFVKQMGAQMDYRVAADQVPPKGDSHQGRMALGWMEAAGQHGIPTAFVIGTDGRIAWIGHPLTLDQPLGQMVAGKWDAKAFAAVQERDRAKAQKLRALGEKLGSVAKTGDLKKTLAVLDQALAKDPSLETQLGLSKFMLLTSMPGSTKQTVDYGHRLLKGVLKDQPQALNNLSWTLVDPKRKKVEPALAALAVEAAQRADQVVQQKDPAVADTLARAYFVAGNAGKAIEAQERAVKLAGKSMPEKRGELNQRLAEYKKAAKK